MTTTEARRVLSFGLNVAIPADAPAAWGCRAIVTQDGTVDVLGDRQDLAGTEEGKAALKAWLNGGSEARRPYLRWQKAARRMLQRLTIQTRQCGQVTLYEDARGIIVGDTNASHGYLYVAAWLKTSAKADTLPPTPCAGVEFGPARLLQ